MRNIACSFPISIEWHFFSLSSARLCKRPVILVEGCAPVLWTPQRKRCHSPVCVQCSLFTYLGTYPHHCDLAFTKDHSFLALHARRSFLNALFLSIRLPSTVSSRLLAFLSPCPFFHPFYWPPPQTRPSFSATLSPNRSFRLRRCSHLIFNYRPPSLQQTQASLSNLPLASDCCSIVSMQQ